MDSFITIFDEKELLLRLQQSDENAFTAIYNHYWKKLFYKAALKLQNLSEAEGIVQDIFLELWRRRAELEITTCLASYLAVCVKHKVIDLLAKRARQLRHHQYISLQTVPADRSVDDILQFEILKEQLAKETAKLPDKCRLVFELSRHEGYSHKQIAKHLGISEKTVESHLSKALRNLRTGLSHVLSALFF
jgi:RNA polymerase sigma-70 factor (ECF subfamily)